MSDDYTNRISRLLETNGLNSYEFGHTRRHRCVIVSIENRTVKYVFPLSGSDRLGPIKAVSGLRRMLGLQNRKSA